MLGSATGGSSYLHSYQPTVARERKLLTLMITIFLNWNKVPVRRWNIQITRELCKGKKWFYTMRMYVRAFCEVSACSSVLGDFEFIPWIWRKEKCIRDWRTVLHMYTHILNPCHSGRFPVTGVPTQTPQLVPARVPEQSRCGRPRLQPLPLRTRALSPRKLWSREGPRPMRCPASVWCSGSGQQTGRWWKGPCYWWRLQYRRTCTKRLVQCGIERWQMERRRRLTCRW